MRHGKAPRRYIQPDAKYQSVKVAKLINALMQDGKKQLAQNICYRAFDIIEEKTQQPGIEVFETAFEKVKPAIESVTQRFGGTSRTVPREVKPVRKASLTTKWLVQGGQKNHGKSMAAKLAREIMEAAQGSSSSHAIKKKETIQKMADSNKAFASFRR